MINRYSSLATADNFCDYTPFISSISGIADIIIKIQINCHIISPIEVKKSHYYTHLKKKSYFRCIVISIPILGNIAIALWDRNQHEKATIKNENIKAKIKTISETLNRLSGLPDEFKLLTYKALHSQIEEIAKNKAHLDLPDSISKDLRKAIKNLHSLVKKETNAEFVEISKSIEATLVQIRTERHEEFAAKGGIVSSDDVHDAFKNGDAKAVKNYIRLGTEDIIKAENTETTLTKANIELVQKGINLLLDHYEDVTVMVVTKLRKNEIPPGSTKPWIIIKHKATNEKIVISKKAWLQTNMMDISISKKRLENYSKLAEAGKFNYNPSQLDFTDRENQVFLEMSDKGQGESFQTNLKEAEAKGFSNAHKLAINVYTGDAYGLINQTMQGNWIPNKDWNPLAIKDLKDLSQGQALKEGFVHAAVVCNGLKKMNPYKGREDQYLFRGEGLRYLGNVEEIKREIDNAAVKGTRYVRRHWGFTSSSYDQPSSSFYTEDKTSAGLLIKQGNGYLVTPYSQYKSSEREVIIPPTPMYYESYKDIPVGERTITLFNVRSV